MNSTRDRLLRAMGQGDIDAKTFPESWSFGQRFVRHDTYRRLRSSGVFKSARPIPSEQRSFPALLLRRELASMIRQRTTVDLSPFGIHPEPLVSTVAAPAMVPGLVEVIEVDEASIILAPESSEVTLSAGVALGAALPEDSVNFGPMPGPTLMGRWGNSLPVARSTLDQPGMVASLLDRRLTLGFFRGLEADILAGDGTGQHFTGIVHASGTHPITARGAGFSGENNYDAIARGVAAVLNSGWYGGAGPIAVVASPTTLLATRQGKDQASAYLDPDHLLADVAGWLPSTFLPDGTAVVGDFFDAIALILQEDLSVEMSSEHADFFGRGLVEMALETRAKLWIRQPSALAVVTGL